MRALVRTTVRMGAVRREQEFRRLRLALLAREHDRACRIARSACRPASARGFSTSPQKRPIGDCACDAEHALSLRIQVTHVAIRIHGEHAFDHARQQRLCVCLAPAQRGRKVEQVATHVFERARQRGRLRPTRHRYRRREIAAAQLRRRIPPATAAAARCAARATAPQRLPPGSGTTPSSPGAARIRPPPSRFPTRAGVLRAARCLRPSTQTAACWTHTGRAARSGPQRFRHATSAIECSALKSGSTLSSQFDSRTSRMGMPVCSDSALASFASK